MAHATIILTTPTNRQKAARWCARMADGVVVRFTEPRRTLSQNDKMWALLTELAAQVEHNGQKYDPQTWKVLCMKACGHEVDFINGLDGRPFPLGMSSSALGKREMADLIEFIYSVGADRGVEFSQ